MPEVRIQVDTADQAYYFALWLRESGEQDYWNWMYIREQEDDDDITVNRFQYENSEVDDIGVLQIKTTTKPNEFNIYKDSY